MIPRLLNLLGFENTRDEVGRPLRRAVRRVPVWVWLPWLPQLQTGLQRPEAPIMKDLLAQIAVAFPQVRPTIFRRPLCKGLELAALSLIVIAYAPL